MPDNKSNGELEDFVIKMKPTDDAIWPRAQTYINRIPTSIKQRSGIKDLQIFVVHEVGRLAD